MMETDPCGYSRAGGLGSGTTIRSVGYAWPADAPIMPGGIGRPREFQPSPIGSVLPSGFFSLHVSPGVRANFRWPC